MARRLKSEAVVEAPETEKSSPMNKLVTEVQVKTRQGGVGTVVVDGFDFSVLKNFTPFESSGKLPQAEIRVNRRGLRILVRAGAPRFYIKGNKLMKVYNGLSGKKSEMIKRFKPEQKPIDRKIKQHLLKLGIPNI